ncbi:hypothetical protein [Streptomyces collinus]
MALNLQVAELDKLIEARFRDHHHFDVITSMPAWASSSVPNSWPPPAET